ncbi:segregation and condensation protein B [Peptostreptococcaceae bacterium pGA-8]|nr:segregation and condensation protein B [Peptostreptococcaceae bacterium pGA-8]
MSSKKIIKSAFESMLFLWGEPLEIKAAADVFGIKNEEAVEYLDELAREYEEEGRGLRIRKIGKSYQMTTAAENEEFIERLCTPVKVKRLSQSALEVLAIIAYRQPVSKGEMEAIRGVRCDRVVEGLLKKELICEKGRSQAVGRPILYGTTDNFLRQFGFSSIKELPEIEDLEGVLTTDDEDTLMGADGTEQLTLTLDESENF